MYRLARTHLFYQLISEIRFDKQLKNRVSDPVLYEIVDRFIDKVCNTATMVVRASGPDGLHGGPGCFGKDEPWPEWAPRHELQQEGLIEPDQPAFSFETPEDSCISAAEK